MALSVAGPQIALISRTVSVTACGVAGGERPPGHDEVDLVGAVVRAPRGRRRADSSRLLAGGEVDHRGDADAGAGELGAGTARRRRGQTQTAATGPCGVRARAAEVGDGGGVAGVVEVGEVEAGERPARRRSRAVDQPRPRQVAGREGAREERAERGARPLALGAGEDHRGVGRRELGELLAAAAAGGDDLGAVGEHQHLGDARLPGGDHGGDRAGLGAGALRIGDVLDVAAGEDAAVRAADRGADLEARIGH